MITLLSVVSVAVSLAGAAAAPMMGVAGVDSPVIRTPEPPRRISAEFEQAPVLDVLRTFADFSGRSIVAGSEVGGDITASIHDQPWDVALEAILRAHGLSSETLSTGIIAVERLEKIRDRERTEELITRPFALRYVKADSLVASIRGLLSDRGRVAASAATNALVVTDGRSVIRRLEPILTSLDARTPQVTIAARILFVDRTTLEGLGVVYDLKDMRGNALNSFAPGYLDGDGDGVIDAGEGTKADVVTLTGRSIAALANATARLETSTLQVLTSLVLGRHTLLTFVEALQSLALSDIQAAPLVTVMDNRDALIQVGEETPIRVVDVGASSQIPPTGGGGTGQPTGIVAPRATVQMKNTGVILAVTPHVTGEHILLELHAERSQAIPTAGDAGVVFQKQVAETQVLVKDGETAVVGGLTLIEKVRERSGVPGLMNVPFIGGLFRRTLHAEHKRDLLILVTPRIVAEP